MLKAEAKLYDLTQPMKWASTRIYAPEIYIADRNVPIYIQNGGHIDITIDDIQLFKLPVRIKYCPLVYLQSNT